MTITYFGIVDVYYRRLLSLFFTTQTVSSDNTTTNMRRLHIKRRIDGELRPGPLHSKLCEKLFLPSEDSKPMVYAPESRDALLYQSTATSRLGHRENVEDILDSGMQQGHRTHDARLVRQEQRVRRQQVRGRERRRRGSG